MDETGIGKRRRRIAGNQRGATLVEVMVAAFLMMIAFSGLAQVYTRGRTQIDLEEDRRKATAVAQARLETVRRTLSYDELQTLDDTLTTYLVDDRSYQISHSVAVGTPEAHATELLITVNWTARLEGGDVNRSLNCATIFSRGLVCPS